MRFLLVNMILKHQSGQIVELGDIELEEHENVFFYNTDEGEWTYKIYDARDWSSITLYKDKASNEPTMKVIYRDQTEE